MGVALALALLASMAIGTAGAAAEGPVFLTKAVVGERAPSEIQMTGTMGVALLETKGGTKVECSDGSGSSVSGTVVGPKGAKRGQLVFTGCKTGEFVCENAGPGVVQTVLLEGELGPITSSLPGLRLWAEGDKGGTLVEASCGGGAIRARIVGTIIGAISGAAGTGPETGKLLPSGKISFSQSHGAQKYQSFEGGEKGQLEVSLNEAGFEDLGASGSGTLRTAISTLELGVTK
jgi:hypothetical protein